MIEFLLIFFHSYELSDGTARHESMELKEGPDGTKLNVVRGWYSYIDTNNQLYRVDYMADENGYVVQKPQQIQAAPLPPRIIATLLGRK
jgi:Insect cuticle protein